MPLWNIVLSGYPASGKTVLARRLVSENPNFVRICVDDLRSMYFDSTQPRARDNEFIYNSLAALRDSTLSNRRSVVLDTTAPRNSTREFLLNSKVRGVVRLLVLMTVGKSELENRNRKRRTLGAVEAWDKAWERPTLQMPVIQFRNNSRTEFKISYYVLTDLLSSEVDPYERRFLDIWPRRPKKPALDREKALLITSPVPLEKSFHFFTDLEKPTGIFARSIFDFEDELKRVKLKSLEFHMTRGDFSNWLKEVIRDDALAEKFEKIRATKLAGEKLRERLAETTGKRCKEIADALH